MKKSFFFLLLLNIAILSAQSNPQINPIAAQFSIPTAPIAITNINVLNVNTGKMDAQQTIVINSGRITTVGPSKKIAVPKDATLIDGSGKFAIPGLIDSHIHFFQSGGLYTRPDGLSIPSVYPYEKDQQWLKENLYDLFARYLACGITTVADVGGPMANYAVREKANTEITAPNALVTGPLISTVQPTVFGNDDPPILKASTPAEAIAMVKKQLSFKPDFIKIWYIANSAADALTNLPIIKVAIDEAHSNGLKVCVHATEYETARLAVEAGADILVHSVDDRLLDAPMLKLLKDKNVVYIPTLQVATNYTRSYSQQFDFGAYDLKYANPFKLGSIMDLQHIDKSLVGFDYKAIRKAYPIHNAQDTIMAKNLMLAYKAGINIVAGTDAGNVGTQHGSSFLHELLLMQQAGLSPLDILRSATINAANGFGKQQEWGSIEPNKIADIILLDKNPLEGLDALEDIKTVIHRGVLLPTEKLLDHSPKTVVQQQLNAYNARNIDAFLAAYSDDVILYDFPDKQWVKGKEAMRPIYEDLFKSAPELHCELVNRIVQGNTVIDQERVSGMGENKVEAVAIYEVKDGKIVRVYFKN